MLMQWRVTSDSGARWFHAAKAELNVPTFWCSQCSHNLLKTFAIVCQKVWRATVGHRSMTLQYITFLYASSESGRFTFDFWHCHGYSQSPLGGRGATYQHRSGPTLLSTSPALFIRPGRVTFSLPPAHSALACQGLLVFQSFYMWPRTNPKTEFRNKKRTKQDYLKLSWFYFSVGLSLRIASNKQVLKSLIEVRKLL